MAHTANLASRSIEEIGVRRSLLEDLSLKILYLRNVASRTGSSHRAKHGHGGAAVTTSAPGAALPGHRYGRRHNFLLSGFSGGLIAFKSIIQRCSNHPSGVAETDRNGRPE